MQIFQWSHIFSVFNSEGEDSFFTPGCGISVGSFDGLHKGHRTLINTLVTECKNKSLLSGVVTFTRPLPGIMHSSGYLGDISTLKERLGLLESLGVDFVILVDFDEHFASMSGEQFFDILIKVCGMKLLCEGVDFRCGYKGAFDKAAIEKYCAGRKIKVAFTEPVYYEIDGQKQRISSSIIRQLIADGKRELASEMLEREV